MSNITFASNPAGTATFTVASPATNTNRTLTLPDETGTLATEADVAAAEGMVLLGTLATGTQTLSGLTLTGYKQLFFDFNNLSHNNGTGTEFRIGSSVVLTGVTASEAIIGGVYVSLFSGATMPFVTRNGGSLPQAAAGQIGQTGYTNATTSIGVSYTAGTVDAGSVRVYGVK
jgi:hypothetical protein